MRSATNKARLVLATCLLAVSVSSATATANAHESDPIRAIPYLRPACDEDRSGSGGNLGNGNAPCAPAGPAVPGSGGPGPGGNTGGGSQPVDNCNWQRASATGPDGGTVGAVPATGGLPVASRDNNGVTEYLQVRTCRRPNGTVYNTGQTRWSPTGQPDPDPSGTIQRLPLVSTMPWITITPALNPEDPRSQIMFLPTWITVPAPSNQPLFNSLTSIYTGATATATATPIGINFDPGNGEDELYCDSLGVAWTYGDDERLDNNPNAIPDACRFEYQELPEANGEVTAQIGLRYSITYTGLTQPLDNGTMTEEYDGPMTPLPLRIREQVAVNVASASSGGARSSN